MCLIMPGFLWSVIIAVVLYVLVNYANFHNPVEDQPFLLRVFNQFWFLSCVFFCQLVGMVSVTICRNEVVAFIVSTSLLMLFCVEEHLHIAFLYPYMWMGYFINKKNLIERVRWLYIITIFVVFIFLLVWWSSKLTIYAIPIKICSLTETGVIIEIDNILITIYRFVLGLSGSLFVILTSYKVLVKTSDIPMVCGGVKALCVLGQYTISIYILQKFTLEYAFKFGHVHMSIMMAYLLFLPVSIIECLFCFYLSKIMMKNKVTRILIGKYNL